jgi:ankyrin repeat protein
MKTNQRNLWILPLLILALFLPGNIYAQLFPPAPDFRLFEAVKNNDVQKVKSILEETPDAFNKDKLNQKGHLDDWPLSTAARNGNLEIVKLLVEHGATVDIGKEAGERTPLMAASSQGHTAVVTYLLSQGADVNVKGKGLTPLLEACRYVLLPFGPAGDKKKTIYILLDNGADVNVQDESWLKTGGTPLMYAVMQGDAALVQALLFKGARLDLKNKDSETALSLAKKKGLEYITQLLEKAEIGRNASPPDLTPHPLFKAVKEGNLDEVKSLLGEGADVNVRTASGSTPLMFAADYNRPDIVTFLLQHGANVNAKNGANNTALIFASLKGHVDVAKELLEKKADANVKNISGGDALIYAVLDRKANVVALLIKHGAGLHEKYDDEKTALMTAIHTDSFDIAKLLITHSADVNITDNNDVTALMIASEKGESDVVEALLKAGADVNKKSKEGKTALIKAISANQVPIVKTLVNHSGNFNRQDALFTAVGAGNLEIVKRLLTNDSDVNMRGFASGTLLMLASEGDFEIVKYLVEKGAEVNKKDDDGKTALMKAVGSFHETGFASLNFLIDHGADLNAVNDRGETALILAAKRGQAEMVRILLEKGSIVSTKDKEGKTAWIYAVEGANSTVMDLLKKAGASQDSVGMEWQGYTSHQKEQFIKMVETREEWTELWKRAFDKPAPNLDFEKYAVACVFLGYSANWLYSISFSKPIMRDNVLVITYGLSQIMLELSGPFRAGGQYHMKVFEKKKDIKMILEKGLSLPWR